jgi:hypothetical protein
MIYSLKKEERGTLEKNVGEERHIHTHTPNDIPFFMKKNVRERGVLEKSVVLGIEP